VDKNNEMSSCHSVKFLLSFTHSFSSWRD